MAEFTPIMTQEDLDAVLGPRLKRERVKFADYEQIKNDLAAARETLTEQNGTITDLTGQLKSARSDLAKTRIALEKGLPAELAARLTGETDEDLRADADTLSALIGAQKHTLEPPKSSEPVSTGRQPDGKFHAADFNELLGNLNLGGN